MFTVYRKRWFILIAFFLLNFFQCIATICLTAFLKQLSEAFNASNVMVTLANTVSSILFFPSFIMATQMYNRISCRKALLICSFMILVGSWVRIYAFANMQFYWIVIG